MLHLHQQRMRKIVTRYVTCLHDFEPLMRIKRMSADYETAVLSLYYGGSVVFSIWVSNKPKSLLEICEDFYYCFCLALSGMGASYGNRTHLTCSTGKLRRQSHHEAFEKKAIGLSPYARMPASHVN